MVLPVVPETWCSCTVSSQAVSWKRTCLPMTLTLGTDFCVCKMMALLVGTHQVRGSLLLRLGWTGVNLLL